MSQVQQVKDATDIIQVIGERIKLNRAGSNFRALCPFHSEKSPSFFVNETLQRFKCFGCNEQGDVITFLEKYEGMSFVEALEYLADRAGITLEKHHHTQEDDDRKKILTVLDLAKEYNHYLLTEHKQGEAGRKYLKDRGVTSDSVKLFQLGYALPGWEGLTRYLHGKKKYPLKLLEQAGLIIRGQGGRYYDRFRSRIIFPLKNHRGQVVGFSGRILDPDKKDAKYINSPETMVYHKSEMLFGYSELLQDIRKKESVVVVEGELDVISSVQAHVNNVVAVKGSALTEDHAKLLGRVVETVLLALDTDEAGVEATKRAIQILQKAKLELRVVPLTGGKDPDDIAKKEPKKWRDLVSKSISVYEFLLQSALASHSPDKPEGKRKIMQEMVPVINGIPMAVERDFYIKKIAEALSVKENVIREDLKRHSDPRKPSRKKPITQPEKESQPESKFDRLQRYALFLLMNNLDELKAKPKLLEQVAELELTQTSFNKILKKLQEFVKNMVKPDLQTFAKTFAQDEQAQVFDIYVDPTFTSNLESSSFKDEWRQVFSKLKSLSIQQKITKITQELDELDDIDELSPDQEARQQELLEQVVLLRKKA